MPLRSTAAAITCAARSSGRAPARTPPERPIGVLSASMIRASGMERDATDEAPEALASPPHARIESPDRRSLRADHAGTGGPSARLGAAARSLSPPLGQRRPALEAHPRDRAGGRERDRRPRPCLL